MKRPDHLLSWLAATTLVLAAATSCGPQNGPTEEPVAPYGYPPGTAAPGQPGEPGQPPPPGEGGGTAEAPHQAPSIPPRPQGSECAAWTPSMPIKHAEDLVSEVNSMGIVALQQVSCRSGALNPPPCDLESCEAWVEYFTYNSLVVYQKFEMDVALEEALKAVKKGRECGLTDQLMARAYIALGYVLADANGEMMKASNAFRWAFLHKWDVDLPFQDPPPTVEMTFKAAKASMGNTVISCVP